MHRSEWCVYRANCRHLLPPLPAWTGSGMLIAVHAEHSKAALANTCLICCVTACLGSVAAEFSCCFCLHLQSSKHVTPISATKYRSMCMFRFVEAYILHCVPYLAPDLIFGPCMILLPFGRLQCTTFRQNVGAMSIGMFCRQEIADALEEVATASQRCSLLSQQHQAGLPDAEPLVDQVRGQASTSTQGLAAPHTVTLLEHLISA